jgi:hypothetical protein
MEEAQAAISWESGKQTMDFGLLYLFDGFTEFHDETALFSHNFNSFL